MPCRHERPLDIHHLALLFFLLLLRLLLLVGFFGNLVKHLVVFGFFGIVVVVIVGFGPPAGPPAGPAHFVVGYLFVVLAESLDLLSVVTLVVLGSVVGIAKVVGVVVVVVFGTIVVVATSAPDLVGLSLVALESAVVQVAAAAPRKLPQVGLTQVGPGKKAIALSLVPSLVALESEVVVFVALGSFVEKTLVALGVASVVGQKLAPALRAHARGLADPGVVGLVDLGASKAVLVDPGASRTEHLVGTAIASVGVADPEASRVGLVEDPPAAWLGIVGVAAAVGLEVDPTVEVSHLGKAAAAIELGDPRAAALEAVAAIGHVDLGASRVELEDPSIEVASVGDTAIGVPAIGVADLEASRVDLVGDPPAAGIEVVETVGLVAAAGLEDPAIGVADPGASRVGLVGDPPAVSFGIEVAEEVEVEVEVDPIEPSHGKVAAAIEHGDPPVAALEVVVAIGTVGPGTSQKVGVGEVDRPG